MFDYQPTVLIIEDDDYIRRFVRQALESEGCTVHEADTVKRGLIEAGTRQPDAIVLDLGLPDEDGMTLIRELRGWTEVPVLVLSARSAEADKVAALDAGADDYLTKPFGVSELLARLRVLLRRHAGGAGNASEISFGDVRVDFAKRVVERNGQHVHLTAMEYRLLAAAGASRQGHDAPRTAARGLGPLACGEQPLPAHLYGAPAPEAGSRSRPARVPAHRDRRRLPLRRLTLAGLGIDGAFTRAAPLLSRRLCGFSYRCDPFNAWSIPMSRNTLAALALIALTAPSHAELAPAAQSTPSDFTLSANMTLASQYRYRGLMQTNNKPAIQGGFDWRIPAACTWATGTPASAGSATATAPSPRPWKWTSTAAIRANWRPACPSIWA